MKKIFNSLLKESTLIKVALIVLLGAGIFSLFIYFKGDANAEATIASAFITAAAALLAVTITIDAQRETTNKIIEAQKIVSDEENKQKEIIRMRKLAWQIYPETIAFLKQLENRTVILEHMSYEIIEKQKEPILDRELPFKIRNYYKFLKSSVLLNTENSLEKVVQLSFLDKEYKLNFIENLLKQIDTIESTVEDVSQEDFLTNKNDIFLSMYKIYDIIQIKNWIEIVKDLNVKLEPYF